MSDFDPATELTAGMADYLRDIIQAPPGRPPRLAPAAGAGLEFFSLPLHLALTAPPYVALGNYLQRRGSFPRRLLDLGCGCGRGTGWLQRHSPPGTAVVGLDLVRELVAAARGRPPSPAFLAASAEALPFPEGVFDLVSSIFSLIHHLDLPALETVFREAARILRPGGIFAFTTPNRLLSQELYHPNRVDDPARRFSRLNRREFAPGEMRSFLNGLVGEPDRFFQDYSLFGLSNPAFQPAWEKTILQLSRMRFSGGRLSAGAAALARHCLPANFRTRHFLNRLNQNAAEMGVTSEEIAAAAEFRPLADGSGALHLLAMLRKGS